MYFLQVQALVEYGKMRLKGEKSGLILNTTNISNGQLILNLTLKIFSIFKLHFSEIFNSSFDNGNGNRIKDLHLQKLFWTHGDLRARIVWKSGKNILRYTVNWWMMGPCQMHRHFENVFKLTATTTVNIYNQTCN